MILESVIGLTGCYLAYRVNNRDSIQARKAKKAIKYKWSMLMDELGKIAENKIRQEYEILDIFIKHYGFDAIISLPGSKKYSDIEKLVPILESYYKSNVAINLTPKKSSIYARFHNIGKPISDKDKIIFAWFKTFYNIQGCVNKNGETLQIKNIEDIKSPTNEIVGYTVYSKIPLGVDFDTIKKSYTIITRTLGKCYMDFLPDQLLMKTSIITKPISNNTPFELISIKPWELYIGMAYDYTPVILDYSINANTIVGGTQGTGKTNIIIESFINLCVQTDEFDLFVAMIGEKNDLRVFRDVRQCRYYANTPEQVLGMLKYLKAEMNRRNKMFSQCKTFCFNIHQYNKINPDNKMKVIHLISDEIADFMEYEDIQDILWDIIRKSRSSGIYVTMGTQRGSLNNMSSEVKGQLANKVCFSQPNTASALTIMSGEDVAKKVMTLEKNREFLVDYAEGVKVAKTLFIDIKKMETLLSPIIEKDKKHLQIDKNGVIIDKNKQKDSKKSRFEEWKVRVNDKNDKGNKGNN